MPGQVSYDVAFSAEGVDAGLLRVIRVLASDEISAPYEVSVELFFDVGDLNSAALLRKNAAVNFFRTTDGAIIRTFAGIVTRVRESAKRFEGKQRVELTLESPLHIVGLYSDYRIYQQMTTKDIVSAILGGLGITTVDWRLSGSYPTREVCTQFGENTLAFISRLLEEDGIFYFFEQGASGPLLVFGDSASSWSKTQPSDQITYNEASGQLGDDAIVELVERARIRPSKVTLRDHDFKKPTLDLTSKAESTAPFSREDYDYPGRYILSSEGDRRAKLRLDGLVADAAGVMARSCAFGLTAGHTFTLSNAPDPSFDQQWVVRGIRHEWSDLHRTGGTKYTNAAHLLPTSQTYRPPMRTPRPIVPGPQTAEVAGPAGQEIFPDEYGRVKVIFPWDRYATGDDKSSCWVRVGQIHTSGSCVVPRIGWEVLVEFEDGDPDKPVIVGRMYNGKYTPPYPLPDHKTMSAMTSQVSPGGAGQNEIRMDDTTGSEQINVQAEKDLNTVTGNNRDEKVTNNQKCGVTVDQTVSIGSNQSLSVSAGTNRLVGGAQKWSVGASRTKTVGGDEKVSVKGSRTTTIGASHTIMTPMTDDVSTSGNFTETIGGSCMEMAVLEVGGAVAGSASVTIGAVKLELSATGKADNTIGAKATTVGGAFVNAAGKDVSFGVKGAKATTVGGAWMANAGGTVTLSAKSAVNITVGGAVALTAASKLVLKVGGSSVSLSGGAVVFQSDSVQITASAVLAETAPMPASK
jgi:type VI secretion system secreted protein VgrG